VVFPPVFSLADSLGAFVKRFTGHGLPASPVHGLIVFLLATLLWWSWRNRGRLIAWIGGHPSRPMQTSVWWDYRKRGGGLQALLRAAPLVEQPTFAEIRSRGVQTPVSTVAVVQHQFPTRTVSSRDFANLEVLGSGGESKAVYKTATNTAWKVFRTPDDPWFQGNTPDMAAARAAVSKRLNDYPSKLPQFPTWIGSRVIAPQAYLKVSGEPFAIGGYEMRMVDKSVKLSNFLDRDWKAKHGISTRRIGKIFLDLYDTICELHSCGVVIGDFKPDNVLVSLKKNAAYVIDAESMTFGSFPCAGFTEGYVDPRLCDRNADVQILRHQHDRDSDWYAFMVMLFEALTNVHPYQGVHTPRKGEAFVPPVVRPLKGISVFNPRVKVPTFVADISTVAPRGLEQLFFEFFEQGVRGRPDRGLLQKLAGGLAMFRRFKPLKQTCWSNFRIPRSWGKSMGKAALQHLYQGSGEVLSAKMVDSAPKLMAREGSVIVDQGRHAFFQDDRHECDHFEWGRDAFVFRRRVSATNPQDPEKFYLVGSGQSPRAIENVSWSSQGDPNIAMQGNCTWWVDTSGKLRSSSASQSLARIPGNISLFSGEAFGVVCSVEDGELSEILLFGRDVKRLASLPPIMGEITNIECSFSERAVWVFLSASWSSETVRHVLVLSAQGQLLGLGAAPASRGAWYSEGVPRAAYEVRSGQVKEPELTCLVDNSVIRVTCRNLRIAPEAYQKTLGGADAKRLLSDGQVLFVS